jgi:hypothetical protein
MDHWRQGEQNSKENCEEDLKFLIEKIQGSALTINFDCMKLFYEPNQADGFLSPFEVPYEDTNKAKADFREGRHKFEVKMFGMSPNYRHSDEFINKTGSSQHPIYGSINITHSKQGGAPVYGKCHAKLKGKVKAISTFLRGDSLIAFSGDHAEPDDFATYDNLYPLFRSMDFATMTRIKKGDKALLDHYMEYQVHGPVKWADVEEITLDSDDLLPQRFKPKLPPDAKSKIRTHAGELKARTHVPIHFVGKW